MFNKEDNFHGIPRDELELLAMNLLPLIREYLESEEGQRLLIGYGDNEEKNNTPN